MIPENRPVIGSDIYELAQKLELSTMDACWAFGLNMPAWTQRIKSEEFRHQPVTDVCLALLTRYLDLYPESCPVEKAILPVDFYFKLEKFNRMQSKTKRLPAELIEGYDFLGAILGRDTSAGYRWVRQGGGTRPVIDRYMNIINKDLGQGITDLSEIRDLTVLEHTARDLPTNFLMASK